MSEIPLLKVTDLVKHFPLRGGILTKPQGWVRAVDGVSFNVQRGESLGLVGESGCGKTTLGRLILRLIEPTGGHIEFGGRNIFAMKGAELNSLRRRMQIIFQDPHSSLNPRMKVGTIVTESLWMDKNLSRHQRKAKAVELLQKVGLRESDLNKYPHEFSGGERQRIGIARSLCVNPELIVADEPVSALDVSIQAQVINLMVELQKEFKLSYVFISHDLSVVEHICERIAVMYHGVIVELAPTAEFIFSPRHPYTKALLSAVPLPDPHQRIKLLVIKGDVSNSIDPPPGCRFHPRCQYVFDLCRFKRPPLVEVSPNHFAACWLNQRRDRSNAKKKLEIGL